MAAVERGVPLSVIREQFEGQRIRVTMRQLQRFVAGRSAGPLMARRTGSSQKERAEAGPRPGGVMVAGEDPR